MAQKMHYLYLLTKQIIQFQGNKIALKKIQKDGKSKLFLGAPFLVLPRAPDGPKTALDVETRIYLRVLTGSG